MKSIILIVWTN